MLIDFSSAGVRAEQHRHDLLADAEQQRLADTARAGRRAARQAADEAVRRLVDRPGTATRPEPEPAGSSREPAAAGKLGGNRR